MEHTHIIPQDVALIFITAGNALLTFKSLKTGTRFTYKVKKSKEQEGKKPVYFCSLLCGPDNENDYMYFGYMKEMNGYLSLNHGNSKTKIGEDAPSYKAFKFIIEHLVHKRKMNDLELWHEGKCCKCGRTLTDPESIERGIGPECIKMMQKKGIEISNL